QHLAPGSIQPVQPARLEAEMVIAGMAQVVHIVVVRPHGADRDLMQQRLPHMAQHAVDQGDLGLAAPAETVAEARRQHEAARAADDHDPMEILRQCPSAVPPGSEYEPARREGYGVAGFATSLTARTRGSSGRSKTTRVSISPRW